MSENNNQEDLSVEDILSSIKNILVDKNGIPVEQETPVQETSPETTETLDDIFDLDASMIVEPQEAQLQNQEAEKIAETPVPEPEPIDLNEVPAFDKLLAEEPSPKPQSEVKEETIDASASLINNFAKVFAEKQQNIAHTAPKSTVQSTDSIDINLETMNISGLVKETLINQVKSSIDTHFEQIATPIITAQTQAWLNENLAAIVEKTIAKEIERVIAKVGS